jgi:hypothetical protein
MWSCSLQKSGLTANGFWDERIGDPGSSILAAFASFNAWSVPEQFVATIV